MANCQGCGTDIQDQDRFCKNCGAPAAASIEDLSDTKRFDPYSSVATANTGDPKSPVFTAAPTTYPLVTGSSPLPTVQSFIKKLLERKLLLLLAAFLLFLFIGTGASIGREMVRNRRIRRAEIARDIERARQAKQLKQTEAARRGFEESIQNAMGFVPTDTLEVEYPDIRGILVASLTSDDSPAALASVQAGDVMVAFGDQPVLNSGDLAKALTTQKPGSEITVKLLRDDAPITTKIRIGIPSVAPFQPKIDPRDQGFVGVGDVARRCCVSGTRRWGLEIHRLIDNSPADLSGFQLGDVITDLDNKPVRTPGELARRIKMLKPRSKVKVGFYRAGVQQSIELTVGHGW